MRMMKKMAQAKNPYGIEEEVEDKVEENDKTEPQKTSEQDATNDENQNSDNAAADEEKDSSETNANPSQQSKNHLRYEKT